MKNLISNMNHSLQVLGYKVKFKNNFDNTHEKIIMKKRKIKDKENNSSSTKITQRFSVNSSGFKTRPEIFYPL